jgi:hypothetical protein
MLWTFLHLAGQVESGSKYKRRIGLSNLDLQIKSPHVYLGRSESLLADG